jgi:type IV secretion system protein VirB9
MKSSLQRRNKMKRTGMKVAVCLLVAVSGLSAVTVHAKDEPRRSERDNRIGYVTYDASNVVEIPVALGVVTRIILEAGEKIKTVGTGFASQCKSETALWCIEAEAGSNQIWVKPMPGATVNNIEMSTDRRDYSIRFVRDYGQASKYRVHFQYPVPEPMAPPFLDKDGVPQYEVFTAEQIRRRAEAVEQVLAGRIGNVNYSMDAGAPGAMDIAPKVAFDDGRFTYLHYPKAREIPAVFYIGADGKEGRANYHVDGELVVVQRIAREFILRLGGTAVRLVNDAYDAQGVATPYGTTDGKRRELKQDGE